MKREDEENREGTSRGMRSLKSPWLTTSSFPELLPQSLLKRVEQRYQRPRLPMFSG